MEEQVAMRLLHADAALSAAAARAAETEAADAARRLARIDAELHGWAAWAVGSTTRPRISWLPFSRRPGGGLLNRSCE